MIQGHKAFRINSKGQLCFLFHAHRPSGEDKGSSVVPLDQWLEAPRRWGRESQGRKYRVAFHFLRDASKIEAFQKLTKNKYVFLPVRCQRVEPKRNSNAGSWLAERIYVSSADARQAISGLSTCA